MNTIDSYQFGEIVINGKKYSSDVIIFPDKVIDNWWRKASHELCPEDIAEISKERPEVLIVGCGAYGMMKVLPELEKMAKNQRIELIVETTDKACDTYNRLCHSKRLVAALHLTC